MKHKLLTVLLTLIAVLSLCFAVSACNDGNGNSSHVHSFTDYVYNDDATCLFDGTETATCSCGETDTRSKGGTALGHIFETYIPNGNATCTKNETETAQCVHCTMTDRREIMNSALGHSMQTVDAKAPTCTEIGWDEYQECSRCHLKENYTQKPALGHEFETYIPNSDATCTENGTETATCIRCDEEDTREQQNSALGHDMQPVAAQEPTCTEEGWEEYEKCSRCEETKGYTAVPPRHTIVETFTPKQCNGKKAIVHRSCSKCEFEEDETIEDISLKARLTRMSGASINGYGNFENTYTIYAEGGYGAFQYKYEFYQGAANGSPTRVHDYSEYNAFILGWSGYDASAGWTLKVFCKDKAGNMTSAVFSLRVDSFTFEGFDGNGGTAVRADLTCLEQTVDKGTHSYQSVKTDPTCTEKGYTTYTCADCGDNYVDDYTDPLGHDWDDGQITQPATCTAVGVKTFTCNRDHDHHKTEEVKIDPSAHEFGDWIPQINAECEKEGTLGHFQCAYCHENFDDKHEHLDSLKIEPLGHEYQNDVCIRCAQHTGLLYVQSGDHYVLIGLGTCTEKKIVIAEEYEGLPVTEIGNGAFRNQDSILSVQIPYGITKIGEYAFYDCDGLTEITIPDSVTEIGDDVFALCSTLKSIMIPASVESIGNRAFMYSNLKEVIFAPESQLKSIGSSAFFDCNLTAFTVPKGVISIGSDAFEGCDNLVSVTFEEPSGWKLSNSQALDATQLQTPAIAAAFLSKTYCDLTWTRETKQQSA